MPGPLGCRISTYKPHIAAKPLSALGSAAPVDVPVVVGFNWYTSFDEPKAEPSSAEGTSYHLPDVAKGEELGSIRGGHCFCFEPLGYVKENNEKLHVFYNQGEEGACVGFGNSRAQTIMRQNKTFDAFWLYDECRKVEGTFPTGEGSTVHAAAQVLEGIGLREQINEEVCTREVGDGPVDLAFGVTAVRWATSLSEVLRALKREGAQAIPFTNSWGTAYPLTTWMPVATFAQLLAENGEAAVYTER
jgi:hypothetical protein